jgi:outer membrane protein
VRIFQPLLFGLIVTISAIELVSLAGCSLPLPTLNGHPATAASPEERWPPPPASEATQAGAKAPARSELDHKLKSLILADAVDIALHNHPATRAAWESAKAAAANVGVHKGQYYPTLGLDLSVSESYRTQSAPTGQHLIFGPNLTLSYLVIDFGGRSASVDGARQALMAADWMHNSVIQDIVLQVELAYDQYVAAKALLEAQHAIVAAAQAGLDAASARRNAGAGTIADELQARTALSKAQLTLQSTEGAVRIARGALAAALNLPATTDLDVQTFALDAPIQALTATVETFIDNALGKRPDLQAARARWLSAQAHATEMRSAALPSLSLAASVGRNFIDGFSNSIDVVFGTLLLHFPLFTGFSQTYAIQQAQAEAEASRAQASVLENQIVLQVFTAYVTLQTAANRTFTAAELVANATQSATVALERYEAGIGTIIELLTAQATLADARAGEILARLDWYASLAQLAHDTGLLGLQTDLLPDSGKPGSGTEVGR